MNVRYRQTILPQVTDGADEVNFQIDKSATKRQICLSVPLTQDRFFSLHTCKYL